MNLTRLLVLALVLGVLMLPMEALAQGTGDIVTGSGATQSGAELEELKRLQAEQLRWDTKYARTQGFWAAMMNSRSTVADYRKKHQIRQQKRTTQRLQCRQDVRRANRDALQRETERCFRALLTLDLEHIRKYKQYVATLAGVPAERIAEAEFHATDLMDAIATLVEAIDAGVYTTANQLKEAKRNLATHYRQPFALARHKVRLERQLTWLHLLTIRSQDILDGSEIFDEVKPTLTNAITCFEAQATAAEDLLVLEDSQSIVDGIRQVHSEAKICLQSVRDAHTLNKELEQTEAENEESEN